MCVYVCLYFCLHPPGGASFFFYTPDVDILREVNAVTFRCFWVVLCKKKKTTIEHALPSRATASVCAVWWFVLFMEHWQRTNLIILSEHMVSCKETCNASELFMYKHDIC